MGVAEGGAIANLTTLAIGTFFCELQLPTAFNARARILL